MDIQLDISGDLALIDKDLEVDNDLYIYKVETNNTSIDLPMKNIFESLYDLTYRAVLTPITYIGQFGINNEGIYNLDLNFGDAIYLDLGEPSTVNMLEVIKNHVSEALSFKPIGVDILNLDIFFTNFQSVKIELKVLIKGNSYTQIYNINTSDIPLLN